jgi:hypothetical protein
MSAITNAERVKALELELDATKRNLADARRKLRERGRHADRIRQAHVDSLVMASHHVSYLNTTRSTQTNIPRTIAIFLFFAIFYFKIKLVISPF